MMLDADAQWVATQLAHVDGGGGAAFKASSYLSNVLEGRLCGALSTSSAHPLRKVNRNENIPTCLADFKYSVHKKLRRK